MLVLVVYSYLPVFLAVSIARISRYKEIQATTMYEMNRGQYSDGQYGYSEQAYLTPDDDGSGGDELKPYEYSEAFADQSIRLG